MMAHWQLLTCVYRIMQVILDHAGGIGSGMPARISKTKPWPAPCLRSIFLAVLLALRLPRWGPGAIATGILARCQEYTKRMPSGCQGNTKGITIACHEGRQEDAMWGIFRTYINAGGNTQVFPPLWQTHAISNCCCYWDGLRRAAVPGTPAPAPELASPGV